MHKYTAPIALFVTLAASTSQGALISLNDSLSGYTNAGTVMDARYRVSNTNWDQMIATSSNVSASTLVQTANLGNHNQVNGVLFDFALDFSPASGWSFTLTPDAGGAASTVSWSTPFNGASPLRPFNALELFVVTGDMNPVNIASGSAAVTNLSFSSSSATTTGSLVDLVSNWIGTGTGGLVRQYLLSDSDMSAFAWTLSGQVRLSFTYQQGQTSPGGNLDERLKFDIKAFEAVPSPGATGAAAVVGAAAARRKRN